jgi:hypothetical protein
LLRKNSNVKAWVLSFFQEAKEWSRFPELIYNPKLHIENNIRANWLLRGILDSTESKFNKLDRDLQLVALESSLFMIGYDVVGVELTRRNQAAASMDRHHSNIPQNICAFCGKPVSEKVMQYCLVAPAEIQG